MAAAAAALFSAGCGGTQRGRVLLCAFLLLVSFFACPSHGANDWHVHHARDGSKSAITEVGGGGDGEEVDCSRFSIKAMLKHTLERIQATVRRRCRLNTSA